MTSKLRATILSTAALIVGGWTSGPPVPGASDPVKATQALYDGIRKCQNKAEPYAERVPYSSRLRRLLARDSRGGEIGCLDFDFFVDGQDQELTAVRVGLVKQPSVTKMVVDVQFDNFGQKFENQIIWTRGGTPPRWVIDDVVGMHTPTGPFRLSNLLTRCH